MPRDELAEALWGDTPPTTWDKALSVIVSKLRGLLATHGIDGAKALTSAFGCYRLEFPEGSWIDVIVAADAAKEAEEALATGKPEKANTAAALAESLVRQPFLPGDNGTWVDEKRRELTEVRVRALSVLADACLLSNDAHEAARWADQAIALEPFRESGYRRLMEAHVAAGNRAEALRVYERCRKLLAEELGTYPSPETESIYRALLETPPSAGDALLRTVYDGLTNSRPGRRQRRDRDCSGPRGGPAAANRRRQELYVPSASRYPLLERDAAPSRGLPPVARARIHAQRVGCAGTREDRRRESLQAPAAVRSLARRDRRRPVDVDAAPDGPRCEPPVRPRSDRAGPARHAAERRWHEADPVDRPVPDRELRAGETADHRPESPLPDVVADGEAASYSDEIVYRIVENADQAVRQVLAGEADVLTEEVPSARVPELAARYPNQLHLVPQQATVWIFVDVRRPPFNDVRVRQALAYAVDRTRMAELHGGALLAQPTCQLVPPTTPGFTRYCPYTVNGDAGGAWKAPDMPEARRLVAASKTRAQTVAVWTTSYYHGEGLYLVALLRQLGYRARLHYIPDLARYFAAVQRAPDAQAAFGGWFGAPHAVDILGLFRCGVNFGHFCDDRIDGQLAQLAKAQSPTVSARLAARIDRELVDRAAVVPLYTPRLPDLTSPRVGNYQASPYGYPLFEQMWVR